MTNMTEDLARGPQPKAGGRIGTIEADVKKLREDLDEVAEFVNKLKAIMAKQILEQPQVQEHLQSLIVDQIEQTFAKPDSHG